MIVLQAFRCGSVIFKALLAAAVVCLSSVSFAFAQEPDPEELVSNSMSQLIAGESITLVTRTGEILKGRFGSYDESENSIVLRSGLTRRSNNLADLSRVEVQRRRGLSAGSMYTGAAVGSVIGLIVGIVASDQNDATGGTYSNGQGGPRGLFIGALAGLTIGTILPITKTKTLTIEF